MVVFEDKEIDEWTRGGVVAIGNFDGVHRGHQAMMGELRRRADELGVPAVAVTFDPAPVELLRPGQAPPRLMSLDDKRDLLRGAGADAVLVIRTSYELLSLEPREFFERVLLGELAVRGLVEGPNFRFGHNRRGDIDMLRRLAEEAGIALSVVEPVASGGDLVSSSRIRERLAAGELREVAEMLGRPHRVRGTVVRGAARGADLGFPTANLEGIEVLLPPHGVYAGRVALENRDYPAAIHLGPNRTFGEVASSLEVHILDFSGELYGRQLRVDLLERVRETMTFANAADLVAQMREDCARVRELVAAGRDR